MPARANLRAPRTDPRDGSSALFPALGLQVLSEDLRFVCRRNACEVSATYNVHSLTEQAVELAFILPGTGPVQAKIGTTPVAAAVVAAEPLDAREAGSLSADARSAGHVLHKAILRGTLRAGRNSIAVRYSQAGDGREHGHGYFSEGSFVYQLRYEVWPLKQWSLARDFKLTLKVEYEREKAPTWFQRWLGRVDTLTCRSELGARIGPQGSRKGRVVAWVTTLPASALPERLICEIGREGLVAR